MAEATTKQSTNLVEYTVSELSFALKRTVEEAYGLVRLRGEISNYNGQHSSGHCYFKLKDENAVIEAVIWRSTLQRLKFKPEQGLEVVVKGKVTTYPNKSTYQIVIDDLEPAGIGALMALLEQRKRALAAEGLFDSGRKLPLPFLPRIVGVVTSPTGAVIRDILHRLADRFPCHVLVWPVRVQGETCAIEVAAAIHGFNGLIVGASVPRPDLIIVARGGGSLEDLWGFNEEIVARAVAAGTIPLISAVGHETDWTIIDLAADYRAPTPTAAAERAVPVRADLHIQVTGFGLRVLSCLRRLVEGQRNLLAALARGLPRQSEILSLPPSALRRGECQPRPRAPRQCPRPSRRTRAFGHKAQAASRAQCGAGRARPARPPRPVGTARAQRSRGALAPVPRCAHGAPQLARISQRACPRLHTDSRRRGPHDPPRRRGPRRRATGHRVRRWPCTCTSRRWRPQGNSKSEACTRARRKAGHIAVSGLATAAWRGYGD
jgi:exodeoxyribonuclease VII large subunit